MGGGEVARYRASTEASALARRFLSPRSALLLKTADNPEGMDGGLFSRIQERDGRGPAGVFLSPVAFSNFYNGVDFLRGKQISDRGRSLSLETRSAAPHKNQGSTLDCASSAWLTTSERSQKIDVPHWWFRRCRPDLPLAGPRNRTQDWG